MCRSRDRRVERTAARFIAIRSAVPELTRSAPIQLNKRFSLRRCAVTISLADDERSPLEFYLFGSLGCRGDVLALVHVCLCRACFQALKRAQSDDSQPLYAAAADSNHTLVAVDRGFFLRRYCSGRRPGSHWLDCTGTARILGPRQLHPAFRRHVPRLIGARRMMLGLSESTPSSAISIRRPYSETPSPRRISPLAQTTDRRVANVVGPSDVRKHFSCLPASNGFSSLMAGELGLTTKDHPPRLCPLAALPRSCAD